MPAQHCNRGGLVCADCMRMMGRYSWSGRTLITQRARLGPLDLLNHPFSFVPCRRQRWTLDQRACPTPTTFKKPESESFPRLRNNRYSYQALTTMFAYLHLLLLVLCSAAPVWAVTEYDAVVLLKNFADSLLAPTSAEIAKKGNSTLFAEDVQGRIDIIGK